jgi:hypothetical protein
MANRQTPPKRPRLRREHAPKQGPASTLPRHRQKRRTEQKLNGGQQSRQRRFEIPPETYRMLVSEADRLAARIYWDKLRLRPLQLRPPCPLSRCDLLFSGCVHCPLLRGYKTVVCRAVKQDMKLFVETIDLFLNRCGAP